MTKGSTRVSKDPEILVRHTTSEGVTQGDGTKEKTRGLHM